MSPSEGTGTRDPGCTDLCKDKIGRSLLADVSIQHTSPIVY